MQKLTPIGVVTMLTLKVRFTAAKTIIKMYFITIKLLHGRNVIIII